MSNTWDSLRWSAFWAWNVHMLVCSSQYWLHLTWWFYIAGSALDKITASLSDLKTRLDSRKCIAPDVFAENMKLRQETHHLGKNLMYIIPSPRAKFWLLNPPDFKCLECRMKEMSNPFCFWVACVHWPNMSEVKMLACFFLSLCSQSAKACVG